MARHHMSNFIKSVARREAHQPQPARSPRGSTPPHSPTWPTSPTASAKPRASRRSRSASRPTRPAWRPSSTLYNLVDNKIDLNVDKIKAGPWPDFDPVAEKLVGEFAEEAKLATDNYVEEFRLPEVS